MSDSAENKKKMLKEIVEQLRDGASPQEVKEKFKDVLEGTASEDIARIEEELVEEGMPRNELQRLCDVHLAVFGEQLEKQKVQPPAGHPISILMEEHKILTHYTERLKIDVNMIEEACDVVYIGDFLTELQDLVKDFADAEKHYLREENVLFPILEKHGVTEPPAIMWMEHNQIREVKRKLRDLVEQWNNMPFLDFKTQLSEVAKPLCEIVPNHFFKENNILFPTALQVMTPEEWENVREEFDEIGYPSFTPAQVLTRLPIATVEKPEIAAASKGVLQFEAGNLSIDEAEAILDTIPLEISFVDQNDTVKYFNKGEKRVFVRTKSVVGRKVQMCHPQKSIHIVNKIVEVFKTGKKDVAEFWMTLNDRFVDIRFFALRGKDGKYLGTLEVVQDVTDIRALEGQRRLLEWKE